MKVSVVVGNHTLLSSINIIMIDFVMIMMIMICSYLLSLYSTSGAASGDQCDYEVLQMQTVPVTMMWGIACNASI